MTDAADQTQSQQPRVPVRGGVVAYLTVDGAVKAAEFYKRAFGAEQAFMYPVDEKGRTMHIHLYINGSSVMRRRRFSGIWPCAGKAAVLHHAARRR
jgi:uncharacterized glyoxalase superfamily protein PhnB